MANRRVHHCPYDLEDEDRVRSRIAAAFIRAKRLGILQPQPCEVCGDSPLRSDGQTYVYGHHADYNRPLSVNWLCGTHHYKWHQEHRVIFAVPAIRHFMPMDFFRLGLEQLAELPTHAAHHLRLLDPSQPTNSPTGKDSV